MSKENKNLSSWNAVPCKKQHLYVILYFCAFGKENLYEAVIYAFVNNLISHSCLYVGRFAWIPLLFFFPDVLPWLKYTSMSYWVLSSHVIM